MFRVRVAIAVVVSLLASANAGAAGLFRAYLASSGNDSNPCTVQLPCRLLPAALNAVADGGEVWILDSANFNGGTVNIGKSVSILALPGQIASFVAVGGGSALNVTAPNVTIGLRNLVFTNNVNNPGTDAIVVNANGAFLSVEDSLFANLPGRGMFMTGNPSTLHVKGTLFRNIAGTGVTIQDGTTANITNSQFLATSGISVQSVSAIPITSLNLSDSEISGTSNGTGVSVVTGQPAGIATAYVTRTTIHGMQTGVECNGNNLGATAIVFLSYDTIVRNTVGILQTGFGVCQSLGNNHLDNATDVSGTLATKALR